MAGVCCHIGWPGTGKPGVLGYTCKLFGADQPVGMARGTWAFGRPANHLLKAFSCVSSPCIDCRCGICVACIGPYARMRGPPRRSGHRVPRLSVSELLPLHKTLRTWTSTVTTALITVIKNTITLLFLLTLLVRLTIEHTPDCRTEPCYRNTGGITVNMLIGFRLAIYGSTSYRVYVALEGCCLQERSTS